MSRISLAADDGDQYTVDELRAFLATLEHRNVPGTARITGRMHGWGGKVRVLSAEWNNAPAE